MKELWGFMAVPTLIGLGLVLEWITTFSSVVKIWMAQAAIYTGMGILAFGLSMLIIFYSVNYFQKFSSL